MRYSEPVIDSRHQLGMNVKHLRKAQRLSQVQLGLMIGRDRSYISRIERGRCNATFDTLLALAGGLGVSPSQLFVGIGEPHRDPAKPPSAFLASPKHPRR